MHQYLRHEVYTINVFLETGYQVVHASLEFPILLRTTLNS